MKIVKQFLCLGLIGFMLFGAIPLANAQTKIDVDGQVVDQNKATVAGASVNLTDEAGQSAEVKTDNQGKFHFPGVAAGTYEVIVYAGNFDTLKDSLKLEKPLQQPLVYTLHTTVNVEVTVNANDTNLATTDIQSNGNAIILSPEDLADCLKIPMICWPH